MADRGKYIEVLSKTVKAVKELNEDAPIKISLKSVEDILELLKEQDQTPIGWISVKDKMPETRHAVLVYTPHHKNIWAATMHEDGNWYIWSPGGRVFLDQDWYGQITHWMPLPEPPKEG